MDVMRLVDPSKLFGENCWLGDFCQYWQLQPAIDCGGNMCSNSNCVVKLVLEWKHMSGGEV